MGFIKEPEGIDFIIQSKPLTKDEEQELSAFIRSLKEKQTKNVKTKLRKGHRIKQREKVIA